MMQDSRSQHKNRASAMNILRSRIYDAEQQRINAVRSAERKEKVGSGDRSERIRTYNFPARPRHRPPHQPDALQIAAGDRRRGAGRTDGGADDRASGRATRRAGRGGVSMAITLSSLRKRDLIAASGCWPRARTCTVGWGLIDKQSRSMESPPPQPRSPQRRVREICARTLDARAARRVMRDARSRRDSRPRRIGLRAYCRSRAWPLDRGATAAHTGRISTPRGFRAPPSRRRTGRAHRGREGILGTAAQTVAGDAGAATGYRDRGRTGAGVAAGRWRP